MHLTRVFFDTLCVSFSFVFLNFLLLKLQFMRIKMYILKTNPLFVVVPVPPKVSLHGDTDAQAVSMSGRAVLDCPLVAGDQPANITWIKNDTVVATTDRAYQLTNGSLVIYDVAVSRRRAVSAREDNYPLPSVF